MDAQDLNALLASAGYPPEEGYRLEYLSTGLENGRTVSSYHISDAEGRRYPPGCCSPRRGRPPG